MDEQIYSRRRSASTGPGSNSGGDLNLGGGGGLDLGDLDGNLSNIDAELKRLEEELAKQEENKPPTPPESNPPADGSGVSHDLGNGYSYEFEPSEGSPGNYDITITYPDGTTDSATGPVEGDDVKTAVENFYTTQLNEKFEGWDNPESEFNRTNFPEQFPSPPPPPSSSSGDETDTYTFGGKEYNFGIGNQNQEFLELDNRIDDLRDYTNNEDLTEEQRDKASDLLNQIDSDLEDGAKQLKEITTQLKDEGALAIKTGNELQEQYDSETDVQKKQTILTGMEQNRKKLDKINASFERWSDISTEFTNRTTEQLADADNDNEKTKKSTADYLALGSLILAGAGAAHDLIDQYFGDEDEAPAQDIAGNMAEQVEAVKQNFPDVIDLQEKFQPDLTRLDQTTKYQDTFGSDPLQDIYGKFNTDTADGGKFLDSLYDQYLLGPDGLPGTEDDITSDTAGYMDKMTWFDDYLQKNPDSEMAKEFTTSISRLGQDEKYMGSKLDSASNIFKPKEEGGFGYSQDDFRSPRQRRVMTLADDLMGSPVNKMLEDSVVSELGKGGDMGDEYFNNQRDKFLGGLAPSLAKQSGLMSGGAQRFARKMTGDYQNTLMSRQNQASNYLSNRGSQLSGISNLINANSVNPVTIAGLGGGGGSQIYGQAGQPTGELLGDPTTAYASSVGQQNYLTDLLNYSNQESLGTTLKKSSESLGTLSDVANQWNDKEED